MLADSLIDVDDLALLVAIADRNPAAFQCFYRRHSRTVYALARRIVGQDQEAEDVVAEVFWELWDKSSRYCPSRGSPYSYLIMLARCRALDKKRGLSVRRQHLLLEWAAAGDPQSFPASGPADDACVTAESRDLVKQAVQKLDTNQRQAIEAVFFDGLTHKETSEKLGIPLGTLKARVRSALFSLRSSLLIHQR